MKQVATGHRVPVTSESLPGRGRAFRRVPAFALLLSALTAGSGAYAQAISGEFSTQRFDPAPGPRNFFTTRGARTDGKMAWSAGLVINYASDPFVLKSCATLTNCSSANPNQPSDVHILRHLLTGDLLGSLTPIERLQIGLKVPVSYANGDGITSAGLPNANNPIRGAGMGDPTLEAKFRAYGEPKDTMVMGAALFASAPLGHVTAENKYIGDRTPVVGLRGIFDGKEGPFSFGANLAGLYRGTGRLGSTEIGSEFRYGVAAGYAASPAVRVILDGFGGTKFSSKEGTNSLEIDGGAQITPLASPITVLAGGGAGVIEGVGVPKFRLFVGVMYVAEASDRDNDGIKDADDQCPTDAEDRDGFEDNDGCPDRDNDGDTIADKDDKCPDKAEDPDGFQDTDGCPDDDNDADGVDDAHDQCPDKKETKNGFKDDDGCPDAMDKDGDGVPDEKDKCPDQKEDTDGFQDTDGCPDPDNDGDGIPDDQDECVDEPETKNGYKDTDGCPDTAPGKPVEAPPPVTKVELKKDRIAVPPVAFATNKETILEESFANLEQVAEILKQNDWIKKMSIEGHTDNRGNPGKNQKLSERRAESVQKFLLGKGISADRLDHKGFGQTKPIADNKTDKGRAANRRVEFLITDPAGGQP